MFCKKHLAESDTVGRVGCSYIRRVPNTSLFDTRLIEFHYNRRNAKLGERLDFIVMLQNVFVLCLKTRIVSIKCSFLIKI